MRVLKSIMRWFFALQAIPFLLMVVFSLLKPRHATHVVSLRSHIAACAFFLMLSLPFVMAWWTTRKTSAKRNVWAIFASLFYLAEGLLLLFALHKFPDHANGLSPRDGLYFVVIGVAGVILFSLRDAVSASELAAVKHAPIAGDRTHPLVYRAFTALSVVLQIACMVLCGHWARSHGLLYRGHIPWFILFTVAVLAASVLHECGHALIAWGFHMKLLGFNAGPIQWQKREGRWKFNFVPAGFINLGGAVRVVPTDAKQPRVHDLWMIAAGPLSNIFFGSVALYLLLSVHWPYYEQTWRLVAYTASFCYIAGITNLLPFMTEDGNYSDGARILQILTNSPLEEYHRTMDSLASTLVTERRYRDLDIDAIQRAASQFPQELRGLFLQLCASNYYLDSGRIREARSALGTAEAIYNDNSIDLPGPLHTPFVIGHAYLNHNAAAARSWWERMEAKKFERNNVDYWLAQSALYWIEGRQKEAEEAWRKADAAAQKLPQIGGAYEFDRMRCALLRQELDHPSTEPVVPVAPVFRVASTPVAPAAPVFRDAPTPAAPVAPFTPFAPVFRVAPTVAAAIAPDVPFAPVASFAPVVAVIPAVTEDNARFDPLQFLRAAAIENLRS
jgi:Zn-dependent protease